MSPLLRILRSARALAPLYAGIFLSALIVAGLGLLSPFFLKHATDAIVAAVSGDGPGLGDGAGRTLALLAVALLVTDVAKTLATNVGGYCGDVMAARLRQILSTRYYAKLLGLPQRYFDYQVTGTIIARLDRSITSITQFLQSMSNSFLPMLFQVAAILVVTSLYYWPLSLLIAAVFPVYMWLTALTSSRWQRYEEQKNEQVDLANGRFSETISQVKVVKSFVAERRELASFGRRYADTVTVTRPQSRWWHLMDTARGCALNVIFFGIYLLIFFRTAGGYMSLGDMVMLIQLVMMAKQPVFMMSWAVDSAQRAIAGSKDYFAVMSEEMEPTVDAHVLAATRASDVPAPADDASVVAPLARQGGADIELVDVSFAYEEGKPVLDEVSFRAGRGEKVALVGESGGGKSTVVNLLLGLYRPTAGKLILCGRDVSELSAAELRASVGVVFQEPFLFSGTIAENIAYGKPDATDEEIEQVARRANAHDFIASFPQGYATVIGERGLRLSGGQKQRVAVARAMLKDAPILVLDEATSALDNKAERAVQAGLDELMKDRTTLIIAHRLSTIAGVDTIVTLTDGRVDEVGSPDELAGSGGIYAELLALTASASAADRARLKKYGFISDHSDRDGEEHDASER
ncbi:ABC transporter ATP-binding protein [Corynebacterium uterequi]|uniref:ABC-type multidrug transport system, ATPase and permease component n=1 Tax=Corynebacterium uterequi TaxID=1072256 RepID=A0A0G3HE03_9CORY|nr:ABC transporter ATP-binding protein [Corynebacterium uterequi]AKK11596.1 ABC-type multidrug transport system, ATPase and permease component [Corynebacterium uterequi]